MSMSTEAEKRLAISVREEEKVTMHQGLLQCCTEGPHIILPSQKLAKAKVKARLRTKEWLRSEAGAKWLDTAASTFHEAPQKALVFAKARILRLRARLAAIEELEKRRMAVVERRDKRVYDLLKKRHILEQQIDVGAALPGREALIVEVTKLT